MHFIAFAVSESEKKTLSQKEIEELAARFGEDSSIDDLNISDNEDRDPYIFYR